MNWEILLGVLAIVIAIIVLFISDIPILKPLGVTAFASGFLFLLALFLNPEEIMIPYITPELLLGLAVISFITSIVFFRSNQIRGWVFARIKWFQLRCARKLDTNELKEILNERLCRHEDHNII